MIGLPPNIDIIAAPRPKPMSGASQRDAPAGFGAAGGGAALAGAVGVGCATGAFGASRGIDWRCMPIDLPPPKRPASAFVAASKPAPAKVIIKTANSFRIVGFLKIALTAVKLKYSPRC